MLAPEHLPQFVYQKWKTLHRRLHALAHLTRS
jgi:hypothetical protein